MRIESDTWGTITIFGNQPSVSSNFYAFEISSELSQIIELNIVTVYSFLRYIKVTLGSTKSQIILNSTLIAYTSQLKFRYTEWDR